jgi:hypothetical protein
MNWKVNNANEYRRISKELDNIYYTYTTNLAVTNSLLRKIKEIRKIATGSTLPFGYDLLQKINKGDYNKINKILKEIYDELLLDKFSR